LGKVFEGKVFLKKSEESFRWHNIILQPQEEDEAKNENTNGKEQSSQS
jgi:hypothetical protein